MEPKVVDWVIIDQTGGAATTSGQAMTPAALAGIAAACQVQLNRDVAAFHGGSYRVRAGSGPSDVGPGELVFQLLPSLPGAPGAIAYHDVGASGQSDAFDAITLSDTLTGEGNSVSVAISHELCEAAGDAACNLWADAGTREYARELCDAVESMSYLLDSSGIYVSNFLLPAFFDPTSPGPYDFMTAAVAGTTGGPSAPFQAAPGGYQIVRDDGSNEGQVTAMCLGAPTISLGVSIPFAASYRRAWRHGSRRHRRGVVGPA